MYVLDEPSAFYAEEIFDSIEGLGTKDEKLQRIFIMRSEVDLVVQVDVGTAETVVSLPRLRSGTPARQPASDPSHAATARSTSIDVSTVSSVGAATVRPTM